jgi:hypothetical protein
VSKDAYYFSHDSNARNDLKVVKLRRLAGLEGVGLYWCLIEMLREEETFKLELSLFDDICFELRVKEEAITKIFDCNLFDNDSTHFWSNSLITRMKKMENSMEKRREAGRRGGLAKSSNAKAKPEQCSSKIVATPSKEKKRNEKKGNEKKEEDLDHSQGEVIAPKPKYPIDFEEFWKAYPKSRRVAKGAAVKAWERAKKSGLPPLDQLLPIVELQKQSQGWLESNGKFIPHPATWINGAQWENEIDTSEPAQSNLTPVQPIRETAVEQFQRRNDEVLQAMMKKIEEKEE